MEDKKARTKFIRIMTLSLVLGVALGIFAGFLRQHLPADVWQVINNIFFQDITTAEGQNALGLFYIVQTMFTNALKLAIVPLVFFSMILSVCSMSDMRKLGRIAAKTVGIFVAFYVVACLFGIVASEIAIGAGLYPQFQIAGATADVQEVSTGNVLATLVFAIPDNFIAPLSTNSEMLCVVACAIIIGLCVTVLGEKIKVFRSFCEDCSEIVQKFIDFVVVKICPFAVFCMIVRTFAVYRAEEVQSILTYMLIDILVLLLYLFVVYPAAVALFLRVNPLIFMKKIAKVGIIAFGTASSSPALPLNLETCTKELGCSKSVADFVLPVGMTINMNGTAITHIIGVAFIATSAGFHVTPAHYLTMTLLAISSSMGAPGVASAGTIMMYAVLTGTGFNTELCTLIFSMLFALHKPCGMVQTILNVVGDAATTMLVAKSEGEFDRSIYES